jgi:hypothetical protein
MIMKNYNTRLEGLTLLFDESPAMFLSLYSSGLNMPDNSIKHALTNTVKRLLKKYFQVKLKIESLSKKKGSFLRYFSTRKAKKALMVVLDQVKNSIFSWVNSSLEKFGLA